MAKKSIEEMLAEINQAGTQKRGSKPGSNGGKSANKPFDYDAAIREAASTRVPRTRRAVKRTTRDRGRQADRPQESQKGIPSELAAFQTVVREKAVRQEGIHPLVMVAELLSTSYRRGSVDIAAMGFDQNNLEQWMRAIFSRTKGNVVPKNAIVRFFKQSVHRFDEFIYYDLLGLEKDSPRELVESRVDALVQAVESLEDLHGYENCGEVTQALENCRIVRDPDTRPEDIADFRKEQLRIIQEEFEFEGSVRPYDVDAIEKMMEDVESGALPRRDCIEFCIVNKELPALEPVRRLREAFRASEHDFKERYQDSLGENDEDVIEALDDRLPEGLAADLEMAAREGKSESELLEVIAESYGIKDKPEELKRRLDQIHRIVAELYPKFLGDEDPKVIEIEEAKPPIDLKEYYAELKASDETKPLIYPFYHLFFALRRPEEKYNDHNKEQHFGGQDQEAVLAKLDEVLGDGMGALLQKAAKDKPKEEFETALIEAIANHYKFCSKNPERLTAKLREIREILCGDDLYPNIGS